MRPSPNSRMNGNKQFVFKGGRINVKETTSNHHSVLEGSTPPSPNRKMALLPDIGLIPTQEEQRSINRSLNKSTDEKHTRKTRAEALPQINNPKAEKRLKELMNLLGKKNPTISKRKPSSNRQDSYTEIQDPSSAEIRREKSNLVLPALTFLSPKPLDKKDIDSMQKKLNKFSRGKVIIKVKQEASSVPKQSKTEESDRSEQRKQPRELSVPVDTKKKVVFKQYSQEASEEKIPSPVSGDSTKAKDANNFKNQNVRFRKFVPQPSLDFDQRIHHVSIDEALDRLTQLTTQSGNARKDLLKIQESALAYKLRFERQSISLNKLNSERDARNQ